MRKPAIPQTPKISDPRERFDMAVKETLEILTGRRGEAIAPLATTATTAQIITKINAILEVMQ